MTRREKYRDLQVKKAPSQLTQEETQVDPSPSAQPVPAPSPYALGSPRVPEYVIVQTGKLWWLYARAADTRMFKVSHLASYTLEEVFKTLSKQGIDHFNVRVLRA